MKNKKNYFFLGVVFFTTFFAAFAFVAIFLAGAFATFLAGAFTFLGAGFLAGAFLGAATFFAVGIEKVIKK